MQNGVVTLRVARGRSRHSPYWHGENVWVTLSSSTIVMSGSVTVTVDAVQPGVRVLVMGLNDRASRSLRAGRVRILGGHRQNDDRGGYRRHDDALAAATPLATTTPVDDRGRHRQNDDALAAATPEAEATTTPTP